MTKPEIEREMVSLQKLMEGLQQKEADAHNRKRLAEIEISACNSYWFTLWQQYDKCKRELQKIK